MAGVSFVVCVSMCVLICVSAEGHISLVGTPTLVFTGHSLPCLHVPGTRATLLKGMAGFIRSLVPEQGGPGAGDIEAGKGMTGRVPPRLIWPSAPAQIGTHMLILTTNVCMSGVI